LFFTTIDLKKKKKKKKKKNNKLFKKKKKKKNKLKKNLKKKKKKKIITYRHCSFSIILPWDSKYISTEPFSIKKIELLSSDYPFL